MSILGNPSAVRCIYRIEVTSLVSNRSEVLLSQLASIGIERQVGIKIANLYFLEGQVSYQAVQEIAQKLICDPVTQQVEIHPAKAGVVTSKHALADNMHRIEIGFRPGVTDTVANELFQAIQRIGISAVAHVATGTRYDFEGHLSPDELERIARSLLVNDVIHRVEFGEIRLQFVEQGLQAPKIQQIELRGLDQEELQRVNVERRLALDMEELHAIQTYFTEEGRPATDGELETLAQTWSEHCVHKTFQAHIHCSYESAFLDTGQSQHAPEHIDSILKTYLRSATAAIAAAWVRSAFVDNAGVIEFDEALDLSFKVETHNHPSAIEPFGGANTGIGGVVRDILGVSHRPIANTDVLCFGPADLAREGLQPGVLHPARIRDGVILGIEDYGNKLGLPTVNGAVLYHPGYTANPLVFCGCVGMGPRDSHPQSPQVGDRIIVLGGRTGRDGLRGATFSSQPMDAQTGTVAGSAVQIGDPITEKGVMEVIVAARDAGLYHAVTDCGAGGLSSAVGEMSEGIGARVQLSHVTLKYTGLAPWEIWLSEAQERMVLAVAPEKVAALEELCQAYWVEHQDIGEFSSSGRLQVFYDQEAVVDLSDQFLHQGRPQRRLTARFRSKTPSTINGPEFGQEPVTSAQDLLLRLLAHPDITSKEWIIRRYDHLVRGATILPPLVGAMGDGPSDAAVLKPLETAGWRGFVLANGINPALGEIDPYAMALSVVDEAIRNAVAVGADPDRIALLDNFCWGNPRDPEQLAGLIRAAQGCHDAALHFGAPFISGKDSLNNEYVGQDGKRHAIPGTLLISSIAIHPDVRQAVSMDLKAPGNRLYLIGDWQGALCGSCALRVAGRAFFGPDEIPQGIPSLPDDAKQTYLALHKAIHEDLIRSAHDLSEGGLAVAAAEMALAGRLGLRLELTALHPHTHLALFAETNGCILVEVAEKDAPAFEGCFRNLHLKDLGVVLPEQAFMVEHNGKQILRLSIGELVKAFSG